MATRVLVIDDEQIVLDSVTKILSEEDYQIDTSLGGRQGLQMALDQDYDVVLTDIRMPDIGGMKVLRDVKRAKPSTPVVIITGYGTVKSAVQAMQLGATDYIEKPFTPDQILESIASALTKAESEPPEVQRIIHKDVMIEVLERAAKDTSFGSDLFYEGADALASYDLTGPEKLAILTGDVDWIEQNLGPLTELQMRWLIQRLSAEIW